jgi:hypothetical protein
LADERGHSLTHISQIFFRIGSKPALLVKIKWRIGAALHAPPDPPFCVPA